MSKVNIAGLNVDALTKEQVLRAIEQRLQSNQKTFIITPYSEFLYHGLMDREVMKTLNRADVSIPDGIGILWAATFLAKPFLASNFYAKIIEGFFQGLTSGLKILLEPLSVKKFFPEKIVGADLFWDLGHIAEKNNYSIFIFGGFGDTPEIVAKKLIERYPNLTIAGTSNKSWDDETAGDDIKKAKPDMLFVGLGPIRQEQWIEKHWEQLPIKLAIGLGGTFDYVAGKVVQPPKFIRNVGLEWLYRLFTQPKRFQRIWNATYGMCLALLRYKVFTSQPYRQNVVAIAVNSDKKILVCKRNPELQKSDSKFFGGSKSKLVDYWQFPQGGKEKHESVEQTGARELHEEAGAQNPKYLFTSKHTHKYDWQNAKRPLFGNPSNLRGQEQSITYFKLSGDDEKIRIDNYEFVDYQWVQPSQLRSILHPERHPLVKIVDSDWPEVEKML